MAKPLVLNIPDDLEQRLQGEAAQRGLSLSDYTIELLQKEQIFADDRREKAIAALQTWIAEGTDTSANGDDFLRMVDEDRLSDRKLFPPEQKGKTW